jgi:heterodisulfide reductase subunit B
VKYAYYPGCTQESTAAEYGESSKAVCRELGIELEEIPDWNCCGASSGHFLDEDLSYALPGRNLAIAEKQGLDTLIICAACYLRLRSTQREAKNSPEFRKKLEDLIGMPYEAKYDVRHLLDVVVNELGLEEMKKKVKKPLKGLKVVAYYGCYLVRPPKIVAFDDPENPTTMDRLLESLGAEVLDWGGKIDCCGGSLPLTRPDIVAVRVGDLVSQAQEVGAEAIVVACPMCHSNLDTRQGTKKTVSGAQPGIEIELGGGPGGGKMPILYFTELMGLAFGIPKARSWFKKHLTNPIPVLEGHNLI